MAGRSEAVRKAIIAAVKGHADDMNTTKVAGRGRIDTTPYPNGKYDARMNPFSKYYDSDYAAQFESRNNKAPGPLRRVAGPALATGAGMAAAVYGAAALKERERKRK